MYMIYITEQMHSNMESVFSIDSRKLWWLCLGAFVSIAKLTGG